MQLFLLGYIIIEICEIFTVGKLPLETNIVKVGSLSHRAAQRLILAGFYWYPPWYDSGDALDPNA
jgi:hypothetical protein